MEYFELGSVVRAHGIKGDLVLYISSDLPLKKKQNITLFLGDDDNRKKFEVTSIRVKDHLATVHLKGIEDRNQAEEQIRKKVYIESGELPDPTPGEFIPAELIGYQVSDKSAGILGEVTDVYDLPQHPVFAINYKGKEALLPATPGFIMNIDSKKKIIFMDLPQGLLDIYI